MNYSALAEKAIAGEALSREEGHALLRSPDADVLQLLDAAYRVRRHYCGNRVHLHMLMNAKSGLCPEDCHYCSQSRVSRASIEKYPLLSEERLVEGARQAKRSQAKRYCIVASGRSPTHRELDYLTRVIRRIKAEVGVGVCASLGLLSEEKAQRLREAGVDQYNHNLNTSERYHASVVTTHAYGDRVSTLRAARGAGLQLCAGAIFGQGESDDDIIDVALALREVEPESIPVNFLQAIPGTPFENISYLTAYQCVRILCLMRLLNPAQEIRVSAGREVHLRSLQPLALYPANSLFVDGYLTTPGQRYEDTVRMLQDMGFDIEEYVTSEPEAGQEVVAGAAAGGCHGAGRS